MLTKNFYGVQKAIHSATTTSGTDINGANGTFSISSVTTNFNGLFKSMVTEGYVFFGDGTTPATVNDIALENSVSTKIKVTYPSAISINEKDEYIEYTATYGVTANEDVTISEVGAALKAYLIISSAGAAHTILCDRTVLDTPITIPAGESKQITYTIRFNY